MIVNLPRPPNTARSTACNLTMLRFVTDMVIFQKLRGLDPRQLKKEKNIMLKITIAENVKENLNKRLVYLAEHFDSVKITDAQPHKVAEVFPAVCTTDKDENEIFFILDADGILYHTSSSVVYEACQDMKTDLAEEDYYVRTREVNTKAGRRCLTAFPGILRKRFYTCWR